MRKFRAEPPYNKDGKTNFRYTAKKSGVYVIYRNSDPVYVGMSKTDVYRTMYRHFQQWNDNTQIRVTYDLKRLRSNFTCRVIICTPAQAERLEKMLILKYKPKDNPMKYSAFQPQKMDKVAYDDFIGTPIESCPF